MQQAAPAAFQPPQPVWLMRPLQALRQKVELDQELDTDLPLARCSTAFAPDANLLSILPDHILVSSDDVRFYVHSPVLLSVSSNMFGGLLSPDKEKENDDHTLSLDDPSSMLNVILHAAYLIPCAPYQPSADTLLAAIEALPKYGLSPEEHLSPSTPLYAVAAAATQDAPLEFYVAAASRGLGPLAAAASRHLNDLAITAISDEQAQRMGAVYYKKLVAMLEWRSCRQQQLLCFPPARHPRTPTPTCTVADQRTLEQAWMLLLADVGTGLFKYTSSQAVMARVGILVDLLDCNDCKLSVAARCQVLQVQLDNLDQQYVIE